MLGVTPRVRWGIVRDPPLLRVVPVASSGVPTDVYDSVNPVVRAALRAVAGPPIVTGRRPILDVGCGSGRLASTLARQDGYQVIGLDIDRQAARLAVDLGVPSVVADVSDAARVPFEDGAFDGALLADVIEHTPDPVETLRSVAAVVKPGGFLIISVPNVAFVLSRAQLLLGRFDHVDSGIFDRTHLRFFTLRTIGATVRRAGLRIERIEGYTLTRPSLRALRAFARMAPGLFAFQLLVVATLPAGPSVSPV